MTYCYCIDVHLLHLNNDYLLNSQTGRLAEFLTNIAVQATDMTNSTSSPVHEVTSAQTDQSTSYLVGLRGSAVERQSLASILSLSCTRPVADG